MEQAIIKFKRLKDAAVLPVFAHNADAGFDLFSAENYSLAPNEIRTFQIGWAAEVPSGHFILVKPKSGLAVKFGIDVLAGVIDEGYRGEWGVVLINLGTENYEVKAGDKIAQAILLPYKQPKMIEVDKISETERGEGGFGSTGR